MPALVRRRSRGPRHMRAACSSCVPCEAFRRKIETPEAIICAQNRRRVAGWPQRGDNFGVGHRRRVTMVHSDTMPLYQVVVLALIQGITEFLPISSTAHLSLAPWLLGWTGSGPDVRYRVARRHAGGDLVYFFRTWLQIIAQGFGIQYGEDETLRQNPRPAVAAGGRHDPGWHLWIRLRKAGGDHVAKSRS